MSLKEKKRSLWEQGIQSPKRLRFFTEEKFCLIKRLWEEFLKKRGIPSKGEKNRGRRKAVARRSRDETRIREERFSGKTSPVVDEAKWTRFWSWRRVLEWEWQMSYEERYEQMVKEIKI